jgi:hypothetical protein
MPAFRQAPPDPEKAARDGVTNYIPSRSQVNVNHRCNDCDSIAKWDIEADDKKLFACDHHRREYVITATSYQEKRIR